MYTKLFSSILDSSVWLLPPASVKVWIMFLAARDRDGMVRMATNHNVASRAHVTLEEATEAIAQLEGPDPHSSNPDNEGRRIERVDGGWMVLNAKVYDDLARKEHLQHLNRIRVANYRVRHKRPLGAEIPPPSGASDTSGTSADPTEPAQPGQTGDPETSEPPAPTPPEPLVIADGASARDTFLARVRNRVAWEQEIDVIKEGLRGKEYQATDEQIESAFRDMIANVVNPANMRLPGFRKFVQSIVAADKALPELGGTKRPQTGKQTPPRGDYSAPTKSNDLPEFQG